MQTTYVSVRSLEQVSIELDPEQPIVGQFPVITGDLNELNYFSGDLPKDDENARLGIHKPAHQHHRSGVITVDGAPLEVTKGALSLIVTGKGINMSRPRAGITSDTDRRAYPYTFGLMSATEIGNQIDNMSTLLERGVATERFIGCFALNEYIVDGQRISQEDFADKNLHSYMETISVLKIPSVERDARIEKMRNYLSQPHIIMLRATEAALRLSDVQDEPLQLKDEMLKRVSTSGQSNAESIKLVDYFAWLQERLGRNLRKLHEAQFAHRVLYHGGNITTNGEIVDLDTLRLPSDYETIADFESACRQDVADAEKNIQLLQRSFGYQPDSLLFSKSYENA